MLLSFQMLPEQPASELLDAAALADGLGYYGCYSADEIYHKDAWLLFAAAAPEQLIRAEAMLSGLLLRARSGSPLG
jgi:hypothetical protein